MADEVLDSRRVDAMRDEVDRFVAELDEEYYLHFAGHKPALELERIYERHASLTELDTATSLEGAPTQLWRFACEGYLGNLTRDHAERAAAAEAQLSVEDGGRSIPYRMLRVELANEPDRGRRQRLEEARLRLLDEQINPINLEAAEIDRAAVRRLGSDNLVDLYTRFGLRLEALADECRALLDDTERLWEVEGDRLMRARVGLGLDEIRSWDTPRVFRAPQLDQFFPSDRMLPALTSTLADLGIDLAGQENVHLDVEQRPNKTPRAFCSPIEVPGKVMLVIQPTGGKDDWEALFHEAGHTEHFAHTDPNLPVEARRLGDNAVTEGWAALFENLVTEHAWLNRRLDVPRVDDLVRGGAVTNLLFARRYSAKLLYELEFFRTDDIPSMRERYVELLGDALKVPVNPESYLDDIDSGFYVISYLRSWAFEAQLREFLRSEFGNEWFARRDSGELLRELWSLGQKPTADELLQDVTGARLEMAAVADRIREGLR